MKEQDWDGVCVCGKTEADGVRCKYGASHNALAIKPRRVPRERLPDDDAGPLFRERLPVRRERL